MAPSSHSASIISGENLPVLRTSAIRFQILSAGAAMDTVTEPSMTTPSLSVRLGHRGATVRNGGGRMQFP